MPLSYRMERGPGIKDGFTREKRSRVSLHLVVMQRRRGEEVSCKGKERPEGRGGGGEEMRAAMERKKGCAEPKKREREGQKARVIMLRSSTVLPPPEEARRDGGTEGIHTVHLLSRPLARLFLIQVCLAGPSDPFVLVALREEIKRETEKRKG